MARKNTKTIPSYIIDKLYSRQERIKKLQEELTKELSSFDFESELLINLLDLGAKIETGSKKVKIRIQKNLRRKIEVL